MLFASFTEQLRYVGWGAADAEALRALLPHVEPRVGLLTEEFYERIREHPDADRVFRDEAQVRRLKQSLQQWVVDLLGANYDHDYVERHRRIGAAHARIGLQQRYVFTAMSVVRLHLLRVAAEAFAETPERDFAARVALGKILDVELSLMLETYREALLERVARVDEIDRTRKVPVNADAARCLDAVESTPAIVMAFDADLRLLVWNRTIARLTGYERDELLCDDPLRILFPERAARERLLAVDLETTDTFEALVRSRAGREHLVRWSVSATGDPGDGRRVIHAIGFDVTELREAERRARNSERLAAVGTMAAGLAHEIRNPLNAASLHVTLLERTLRQTQGPSTGPMLEAAQVLRGELGRLSSLVSEFLDFARPRPLRLAPVDLTAPCSSVVELLAPDAAARGVALVFEAPGKPVRADVDEERLRQVLINLARNAVEAAADAGGGHVTLRTRRVGAFAEVDVEDDGPGIADTTNIFDAFFTTKAQGTGLGLSIVHRIVDDHGGSVAVQSEPGQTTFTVRLPGSLG